MNRFLESEGRDGLTLYDAETDSVHVLNETGCFIYRRHHEGAGLDEVVRELSERYPSVPPEVLREDVGAFLTLLQTKGLVAREE